MPISSTIPFHGQQINVIYYNDTHGQVKNIDGFLAAREQFYKKGSKTPTMTLSAGDVFIDTCRNNRKVAERLLAVTDAIAPGNHDIECGEDYLKKLISLCNLKHKFISANTKFKDQRLNRLMPKSKILEIKGEKIGIIGLAPMDFRKLAFLKPSNENIKIQDIKGTLNALKQEVKKLESKGIDKIILLAHTGELDENGTNYYNLFSSIGGIDLIIGGHDHKEINRIAKSKRQEPVLIVSTGANKKHSFGENLDYFGTLNLEFDKNGVLIIEKCKRKFLRTPKTESSSLKSTPIYHFDTPLVYSNPLLEHSEIANLIADSNLWYVNKHTKGKKADFAILNPGTIRDNFDSKDIDEEKVISTLPFTVSKLIKTQLTKKQIIETLTHGAKSTQFGKVSPGIIHVSGLEYTINKDLSISDIHILDEEGNIKYSLDDFDDSDNFTCVYDVFLATGVAGLNALKKESNDKDTEYFDTSRQDALFEYLTKSKNLYDYKTIRIKQN